MRIGHCVHGLGLGGAQKVIASIVRGRERGAFSHYVYSSSGGVLADEITAAGARVRVVERHIPKLDPVWATALGRSIRRDRIDLLHTHLFGDTLHGMLAVLGRATPVVMTLHNVAEAFSSLQRAGYRFLLPRCRRAVACSRFAHASFARAYPGQAAKLATIVNGIEGPAASPPRSEHRKRVLGELGIDPGAKVLVSLGRLTPQKGFDLLITAFAQLRRRAPDAEAVRLVLLGEGPQRAELEEQARREGVAEAVLFTGFRSDAAHLLPAFDAVVFSSRFEGLPVALLEAMAAGCCIVGSDVEGIVEGLGDDAAAANPEERAGRIVPVGDVVRLAEVLAEVLADAEERRSLGEAARRRFLEHFTADRMVNAYEELYREVAGEPPGAPS